MGPIEEMMKGEKQEASINDFLKTNSMDQFEKNNKALFQKGFSLISPSGRKIDQENVGNDQENLT